MKLKGVRKTNNLWYRDRETLNAVFVNVTSDYRLLLKIIQTLGLFNSKLNPAFRVLVVFPLYTTWPISPLHIISFTSTSRFCVDVHWERAVDTESWTTTISIGCVGGRAVKSHSSIKRTPCSLMSARCCLF